MHQMLQQAAKDAASMGPAVLVQGIVVHRPSDVIAAPALSVDDKRTILAAWASDLYTVDSKPALRHLPGTPAPVSIDEIRNALDRLDHRYGV